MGQMSRWTGDSFDVPIRVYKYINSVLCVVCSERGLSIIFRVMMDNEQGVMAREDHEFTRISVYI